MKKNIIRLKAMVKTVILPIALLSASLNVQSQTENATVKFPFPQNYPYRYGTKFNSIGATAQLELLFNNWKKNYYVESPDKKMARIKHIEANETKGDNTTSQDIGFGMLISLWMENNFGTNKQMFDRLYAFYMFNKDPMSGILMNRKVSGFSGTVAAPIENNQNSNTSADCDVATALILAAHQWPADSVYYNAEADTLLNAIWQSEILVFDYHVKPGDTFDNWLNPSYFATNEFELFHTFQPSRGWNKVRDKAYSILKTVADANTGLLPDWINNDGQYSLITVDAQNPQFTSFFLNDAVRIPWRMAMAYSWYGHEDAKNIASKMTDWASTKYSNDPSKIVNGYFLNGSPFSASQASSEVDLSSIYPTEGSELNPCFIGSLGVGGMVDSLKFKQWTSSTWTTASQVDWWGTTYSNTMQLLCMLYLTGNMPNYIENDCRISDASLNFVGSQVTVQFKNNDLDTSSAIASLLNFSVVDKSMKTYIPTKIKILNTKSFVLTLPKNLISGPFYLNYQGTSLLAASGKPIDAFNKLLIDDWYCACGSAFPMSARIDSAATRITLLMSKELAEESIDANEFTITANGDTANIASVTMDSLNAKKIVFLLDKPIDKSYSTVRLFYHGINLYSIAYSLVEAFQVSVNYRYCCGAVVSSNQLQNPQLIIAPNPAIDKLIITFPLGITPHHITLISNDGKTLTLPIAAQSEAIWQVSLTGIPRGIYTIAILTDKEVLHQNLIVE